MNKGGGKKHYLKADREVIKKKKTHKNQKTLACCLQKDSFSLCFTPVLLSKQGFLFFLFLLHIGRAYLTLRSVRRGLDCSDPNLFCACVMSGLDFCQPL